MDTLSQDFLNVSFLSSSSSFDAGNENSCVLAKKPQLLDISFDSSDSFEPISIPHRNERGDSVRDRMNANDSQFLDMSFDSSDSFEPILIPHRNVNKKSVQVHPVEAQTQKLVGHCLRHNTSYSNLFKLPDSAFGPWSTL